ncbi:MAG TPA: hypothetical protein VJH22_06575 [Candidatus Nanoarchaeia archaeon]|nr:hypothetical protein [Candidatus Nanoarchaeia archaeon]
MFSFLRQNYDLLHSRYQTVLQDPPERKRVITPKGSLARDLDELASFHGLLVRLCAGVQRHAIAGQNSRAPGLADHIDTVLVDRIDHVTPHIASLGGYDSAVEYYAGWLSDQGRHVDNETIGRALVHDMSAENAARFLGDLVDTHYLGHRAGIPYGYDVVIIGGHDGHIKSIMGDPLDPRGRDLVVGSYFDEAIHHVHPRTELSIDPFLSAAHGTLSTPLSRGLASPRFSLYGIERHQVSQVNGGIAVGPSARTAQVQALFEREEACNHLTYLAQRLRYLVYQQETSVRNTLQKQGVSLPPKDSPLLAQQQARFFVFYDMWDLVGMDTVLAPFQETLLERSLQGRNVLMLSPEKITTREEHASDLKSRLLNLPAQAPQSRP